MKKFVIIDGDDWEGLYIDGILVDEGHSLNEGTRREIWLRKMLSDHSGSLEDLQCGYLEDSETYFEDRGSLPSTLSELLPYVIFEENE